MTWGLEANSRRQWVVATAASATLLLPLHKEADTRTHIVEGGWFAMVRSQHEAISQTFDALLDSSDSSQLRRESLLRTLAFQMTAHSVAEENVLYAALALNGLVRESDRLYLEQAHAKVLSAQLQVASAAQRTGSNPWRSDVRRLRDMVLSHARKDEEEELFPRLVQLLDENDNQALALAYDREYGQIRSVVASRFT